MSSEVGAGLEFLRGEVMRLASAAYLLMRNLRRTFRALFFVLGRAGLFLGALGGSKRFRGIIFWRVESFSEAWGFGRGWGRVFGVATVVQVRILYKFI